MTDQSRVRFIFKNASNLFESGTAGLSNVVPTMYLKQMVWATPDQFHGHAILPHGENRSINRT